MHQPDTRELSTAEADRFLCQVLRGGDPQWPGKYDAGFEKVVLQQALTHGVHVLVYERIKQKEWWSGWSADAKSYLEETVKAAVAFELFRRKKVSEVFSKFSQRGIGFLVTKGEALARTHYSQASMRTRHDIDLFVDMADISSIRNTLENSDFVIIPPIYKTHQFTGLWGQGGHNAIRFDVHWRILNAARFARSIGFSEALEQSVLLPGTDNCRTLGVVDSLLLACMHRNSSKTHDPNRLIWLYDIHLLVTSMTADQLAAFVKKAVNRNVQSVCLDSLRQAQVRLETTIPDKVMRHLSLEEKPPKGINKFSDSNLALILDDLKSLPDFRSKWGLIQELFFPPSASLMDKYDKKTRLWLPWLYLRQILGGLGKRLALK